MIVVTITVTLAILPSVSLSNIIVLTFMVRRSTKFTIAPIIDITVFFGGVVYL